MIYAIGDSFTYGDELPCQELAWPAQLSKKLNKDVLNQGKPASGNHRIVKRCIDAVINQAEMIIVGWSDCHRQEFADEIGIYDIWAGRNAQAFQLKDPTYRITLIKYLTAYDFPQYHYANWLRQIILVQNLCKANNIPIVMFTACGSHETHNEYHKEFEKLIIGIDTSVFINHNMSTAAVEWVYGTPHGPNGHPLEEGHKIISNKIYEHIRSLGRIS